MTSKQKYLAALKQIKEAKIMKEEALETIEKCYDTISYNEEYVLEADEAINSAEAMIIKLTK